jgi:hypothetical protein
MIPGQVRRVDAIGKVDGLALERGIPRLEFVVRGEYGST